MNRQEYIKIKSTNPIRIGYELYKEKFDKSKHSPFLNENEFYQYFQMGDANHMLGKAFKYYDEKYNVNAVCDKEGKIICYY